MAEENESITIVEISLAALWEIVVTRELHDLKTLALVLALRDRQPAPMRHQNHIFQCDLRFRHFLLVFRDIKASTSNPTFLQGGD